MEVYTEVFAMERTTNNYLALILLALLVQAAGCGSPASPSQSGKASNETTSTPPKTSSEAASTEQKPEAGTLTTAHAVLEKMVAAYRNAPSYEDFATAEFWEEGAKEGHRADFQVVFQRPNKLRMKLYQGELTCDGKKWFGY